MKEQEVFRLTLIVGEYYDTSIYTRREGKWPNEKYYTTNELRYVGKFVRHEQIGFGDGAQHKGIFIRYGNIEIVNYTYEGTTCFRQIKE